MERTCRGWISVKRILTWQFLEQTIVLEVGSEGADAEGVESGAGEDSKLLQTIPRGHADLPLAAQLSSSSPCVPKPIHAIPSVLFVNQCLALRRC
jgi:hypothetical protein